MSEEIIYPHDIMRPADDPKHPLNRWLDNSIDVTRDNGMEKSTILRYLAELIFVNNGNSVVSGWGQVQYGVGPYGRMGLLINEAVALINLTGILMGFYFSTTDEEAQKLKVQAQKRIQGEMDRVKAGGDVGNCGRTGIEIATEGDLKALGSRNGRTKK